MNRLSCGVVVVVSVFLALSASPVLAGWLGDLAAQVGVELGERAVRDAADGAYDSAKEAVRAKEDPAPPGTGVVADATAVRHSSRPGRVGAESRGRQAAPGKRTVDPAEILAPGEFIPGTKELFVEDFAGDRPGAFPRRWTMRGPDRNNWKAPVEVVRYDGRNWLRHRPSNVREDVVSSVYARLDAGKDMPKRFTVEFDALLPAYDGDEQPPEYRLLLVNSGGAFQRRDFEVGPNAVRIGSAGASSRTTRLKFERGDGQIHRIAVSVDGSAVKAYLDGEMVVNDPEGIDRPITVIGMELAYQTGPRIVPLMFTNFRVAAVDAGDRAAGIRR